MSKLGFTLIEVLIVIGIIAILASISTISYGNIQARAQGNKIASDMQKIELAWQLWKNATNSAWPDENLYGTGTHPDLPCEGDPGVSETPASTYLGNKYTDPWGIEYSYDNDLDVYPTNGRAAGVNILTSWCAGGGTRYIKIARFVDESIDGGDGSDTGKIRWNTNPNAIGAIIYMLAPRSDY